MQYTLKDSFTITGIGLHAGLETTVTLQPSYQATGRYFQRIDLLGSPKIPAIVENVQQTQLSTELGVGETRVRTVEHLLAALVATGVDHVCITIDGPEVPLLDGSAKIWVEAINKVGLTEIESSSLITPIITEAIWRHQGDAFVAAIPSSYTCFSYGIDFPTSAIGNQWYSWNPQGESFSEAIAPARTFALASQILSLQQAGLIKGGSLENALVCDQKQWLNPPLRFTNEPVRHKILDLVGDLSLLGTIPVAHYLAYKASHQLHVQLAQAIKE